MRTPFQRLTLLGLSALLGLTACKKEDEQLVPSAPQITSEVSTLPVKVGETKTFTITLSAAGKIKDITGEADKGAVQVADVKGIGTNAGSATIQYTAPVEEGTPTITLKVTDQANQQQEMKVSVNVTSLPPVELTAGDAEGVWGPSRTYIVRGNLRVPKGKTLTIKEGVTVIVEGDGTQGGSPEITVEGSFYSYGTPEKPVLFTVPEARRTEANIFTGLWGGILGTMDSPAMVIVNTRIEYVGAPAQANSPIVTSGEIKEGDPRYGLYFTNPNGKFVMLHSTIAYSKDDGMRINQGQFLVAYNSYLYNGKTGGEALNIKSGSLGDVAYNVFMQAATNGVKCSNSDDRSPQTDVYIYNNTALNCGWRQTKSGRGGSFNLEKGGKGKVYNNLIVNCRFGIRFPKSPDNPDLANSSAGYSLYYGNHMDIVTEFYPLAGSLKKGDSETSHDIAGGAGENNPAFVNFSITPFDLNAAKSTDGFKFSGTYDLHLQAGSPALNKGKTGFAPKIASLVIDGKMYSAPAPANYIGAFGSK